MFEALAFRSLCPVRYKLRGDGKSKSYVFTVNVKKRI